MQGVLAFVVYPVLSAHLGTGSFGYLMLALSFTNFVIPVFAGAFANSLMRQHKDIPKKEQGGFWLTSAVMIVLIGSVIGIGLTFFAPYLSARWKIPELAIWLPALVPAMLGTMLYYNLRLQLIAKVAFKRMVFCDVFYGFGLFIVPLGVKLGWLGDRWPLLFAVAPVLGIIAVVAYLVPNKALSFEGAGITAAKKVFIPMSIYIIGLAAAWVMRMGDRWILGEAGLPGDQIAYYTVAIQASFLVLFPLEHVSVVLMSMFSNVKTLDEIQGSQLKRYFISIALAMAGLAVGGPILGYAYIRLLFGVEYLKVGMTVFLITNTALVIYLLQMFARGIIVRFRHPVTDPIVSVIFAVISMGLIWILVPRFGVIGVAVGRNIGFVGVGLVFFFLCQRPLLGRLFSKNRGDENAVSSVSPRGSALDQCSD